MQIIQNFRLLESPASWSSGDYDDQDVRLYFDPTKFTGVTQILFRLSAGISAPSTEAVIELYDLDTLDIISTITVSGGISWRTSSDITSSIGASARKLGIRCKNSAGTLTQAQTASMLQLLIYQDDDNASRKTETRFPVLHESNQGAIVTMTNLTAPMVWDFLTGIDGTVTIKLEGSFFASLSRTIDIDIYDYTANAIVANSAIQVTATVATYGISGSLTLDPTHSYCVRGKLSSAGASLETGPCWLVVQQSVYQKVNPVLLNLYGVDNEEEASWYTASYSNKFNKTGLQADDSIEYHFLNIWSCNKVSGDPGQRLYNQTDAALVTGTEHHSASTGGVDQFHDDVITAPDDADIVVLQTYGREAFSWPLHFIYAIMTENFPAAPYLTPDSTQPTGYHCFISNFVKNSLAGYVPLLTPDGVNKVW